jgi:hypothetical protein
MSDLSIPSRRASIPKIRVGPEGASISQLAVLLPNGQFFESEGTPGSDVATIAFARQSPGGRMFRRRVDVGPWEVAPDA